MKLFDTYNPAVQSRHIDVAAATPYMMTLGAMWGSKLEQSVIVRHVEGFSLYTVTRLQTRNLVRNT